MKKQSFFESSNIKLIGRGLLIGLVSGLVVGSFRWLIEQSLFVWKAIYKLSHQQPSYLVAILGILMILAVLIGLLIKQEPHISGSGIPEVEIQLRGRLDLSWWRILWRKYVGGVLAIGSGLFLGREGPSIQLGSSVGQGLAKLMKSSRSNTRIMIASGAASGLSAAFNAPIAGTMFVLEEIFHNFSTRVWLSALSGSLIANFVTSNFFGLKPVLAMGYQNIFPLRLYWHLVVLGVLLGLFGLLYQKILLSTPKIYEKVAILPRYLDGLIPFVLLVPIGYFFPQLLGGGNSLILGLDQLQVTLMTLVGIFLLRFVFSMVSYGSGLPGGIFLPILTLGALLGALYGSLMVRLGLLPVELIPNLIIVGMAGYFAGISKAPFTAILLITEMVGNLQHLMPLAIVSLVAYLVVDVFLGEPIYETLAAKMVQDNQKLDYSGKTDQLTLSIHEESAIAGMEVQQINWPETTLIIQINRGTKTIVPNGKTKIEVGDFLTLVVDRNKRLNVRQQLEQNNKKTG